ncbi:MAG TPA: PDZ domain-containing protein [Planctomycetes bacterium]|nr:PDZ domain-containing protein [Planctomycetota bacterium]
MQSRQLFLTSLLLSTPALAFPSLQDREASSQEISGLAEKASVEAELAKVEVEFLREQFEASREGMEVKRLSLATEGQGPDRGYLGVQMTIEDGVMIVESVMPGSGADKAGLQAGDRILSVNKIKFDQEGGEEKLASLKAGKKAKVHFERPGEGSVHIMRTTVSLSPLSAIDQGGESRVQVNRLRRVTEAEEDGGGEQPTRRVRVRKSLERDVELHSPEGRARVMRDGEKGGNVMFFGPGEGPGSKIADHDEDSGTFEVHFRATPDGESLRLRGSQDVEIHADGDHSESDSARSLGRAIVKRRSEDVQERVMKLRLDGHDLEGLPGNVREHIRKLIREQGGEGEHQIRVRMDRDHEENGEESDVHVMHLGDGGGTWVMKDGDHAPEGQRRVEVFSGEHDGPHVTRDFGVDLEGLPEHIRELIREHEGDSDQGSRGFFIIDSEGDDHQAHEHDGQDHDVRVLHFGDGGGRGMRLGGEVNVDIEIEHDGHDGHDGHETQGKAIIKMLTGDGERTMELDFDGADLREMGGRVRQLMAGRDFDLRDILARVRGGQDDRSDRDSRGLHREEDHDGRGDRDSRDLHREEDHGGRGDRDSRDLHREEDHGGREYRDSRDLHREEDHGGRGDRDSRDLHRDEDHGGRGDRDSRDLHREEDHGGRGDRDSRDMYQEQDRRMDRPQVFSRGRGRGRGRGTGVMWGRGRGGPDMFPHEEHDGDEDEFEERIEELEERIEELEALLERFRGRRDR